MKKLYRQLIVVLISYLFISLNCQTTIAQISGEKKQSTKTTNQKSENPSILRWKIFLDSLAQEARTVFPEERRPYAIVEVANAYWSIDRETSRALFISALDTAWSLTEQDKKNRPALNHVLSTATKLDSALTKTLTERLLDKEDSDKDRDEISSSTALEILETDLGKAAQLAEAFAPNGLQYGTANFFIFRLAAQDIQLANRVYGVYLNKVNANENIPLESIIRLAGFAFGYGEQFSIDKRGQMSGQTFPPIKGFSANPAFTNAFLNLAYRRIAKTIERRNSAAGAEEIENLNFPILFALEYLMPEVAKFAPNSLSAWQQLQQQGNVRTTPQQMQQVAKHIQAINQSRARLQKLKESPYASEQEAEASLEDVEKIVGTCQRDTVYSKAALTFSGNKKFKRASELAGKIEDLNQSQSVKQVIAYDTATAAIKNGDFDEAQENLKKISSLELKSLIYAKLAEALAEKNETAQSSKIISEAVEVIEKLPEAETRTGFLFRLSAIRLKTDATEAEALIRNAVKNLNKQEAKDQMRFSIPIKVSLDCQNKDGTWYGGFASPPNSSVFEAMALFAKHNPDEARLVAENIDDKVTKIRALAIITKLALTNKKTRTVKQF